MFKVVALKQLKLTAVKSDDGFPSSSLREISVLLEIQHPNVVRCREVARSSAFAYMYGMLDSCVRTSVPRLRSADMPLAVVTLVAVLYHDATPFQTL